MTARPHRWILPLLLAASTPGCCSLASIWCGPDRSDWVQVGFSTPEEAVASVLEAVRRGNADVLFQASTRGLRGRLGIQDRLTMRSVWARLQDEVTGLNALGEGTPGPAIAIEPERVRFDVEVRGEVVPLTFRRMPWRWRLQATLQIDGRGVQERDDRTTTQPKISFLDPARSPTGEATLIGMPSVPTSLELESADQLDRVEFVREWLLDDLPLPTERAP